MINNPATLPVGGSSYENLKSFTYKGGNIPYHFSARDNNLSYYYSCNIILFADNEEHAKSILKDLFLFYIECNMIPYIGYEHFSDRNRHKAMEYQGYLDAIDRIKLIPAPTNQVYKITWADNDNL